MQVEKMAISGVYEVRSQPHLDSSGCYTTTFAWPLLRLQGFTQAFLYDIETMIPYRNTFRGFYFQNYPRDASVLVRCVQGRCLVLAADLRANSQTRLKCVVKELSGLNGAQLVTEKGFAHAFLSLEDSTLIQIKMDAPLDTAFARSFRWDDPELEIPWPQGLQLDPSTFVISAADQCAPCVAECGCNY